MTVSHKTTQLNVEKKASKPVLFFSGLRDEMKKVSWTNKADLRVSGKVVLSAIFFLGIGLYFIDLTIRSVLNGITFALRGVGF